MPRGGQIRDLSGQRFGSLAVVAGPIMRREGPALRAYWRCRCDCGQVATVRGNKLVSGQTTSCGCARAQRSIPAANAARGVVASPDALLAHAARRAADVASPDSMVAAWAKARGLTWEAIGAQLGIPQPQVVRLLLCGVPKPRPAAKFDRDIAAVAQLIGCEPGKLAAMFRET